MECKHVSNVHDFACPSNVSSRWPSQFLSHTWWLALYCTCGENSSVNQPITLEPFSWHPTEVGIVGYWRYLAVVLKPAKYIKYIQICSIYLLGDIFELIIQQGWNHMFLSKNSKPVEVRSLPSDGREVKEQHKTADRDGVWATCFKMIQI